MAEDQPLEQKIIGSAAGVSAAVDQYPYFVEGLAVDDGLVSALHNDPVLTVLLDALFGLIIDLPGATLNHAADVGLILQHIRDALAGP